MIKALWKPPFQGTLAGPPPNALQKKKKKCLLSPPHFSFCEQDVKLPSPGLS